MLTFTCYSKHMHACIGTVMTEKITFKCAIYFKFFIITMGWWVCYKDL